MYLGPPAVVIYDLRGTFRDLEHGRRHRSVQRPANMHRLGALVRNVFHGAQAHVGFSRFASCAGGRRRCVGLASVLKS